MKTPAALTEQEIEVLRRGRTDPNLITDYFFRPIGGAKGFKFDENFDPEGAWQIPAFFATQSDIRVSGGVGSGKTVAAGMAACVFSLTVHPNFKFMNVAPTSYQANQMYENILTMAEGTPFQRLIWRDPSKPFPLIELRFKIYNTLVVSSMQFLSIDKNARNIFSFEGDWIHIDEAGMITNLEEVIVSLGSRLRGSFRGRERIGRLSMTTNPWENPYFWYLFDLAQGDPENNLSMVVSTRHNHNVTKAQLERILARIPESERDRFIDGARPEGKGDYFSKEAVYACEDEEWGRQIESMVSSGESGYSLHKSTGIGVDYFKIPKEKESMYMVIGDPGTGSAPNRNAPALMVFKVDDFPKKRAEMVSMWWGNGEGSIAPFVRQMCEYMQYYKPIFVGVDSTSTQKSTAETINALIESTSNDEDGSLVFGMRFDLKGCPKVAGLDFSGAKKASYLVSLQFLLETHLFRWPKFLYGLRGQLTNYNPYEDRTPATSKIPQDLVSVMSMAAYIVRRWFYVEEESESNVEEVDISIDENPGRILRSSARERARRDPGSRPQAH